MFTKIKVQNYKSLVRLEVDLSYKQDKKPLAIIYGENGVGKSNFASVFYTLYESLRTMSIRNVLQQILDNRQDADDDLLRFLRKNLRETDALIKSCKTINSKENMILCFEFMLDGLKGEYTIEYDDVKLVYEKLEFVLNKNKTVLYELSGDDAKINDKIFSDGDYAREFKGLLNKYWGKHTLLSILLFEKEDKADGYIEQRIHPRLYRVIAAFMTMSIKVKAGNRAERGTIGLKHRILRELGQGEIDRAEEAELRKAELMVNEFFTLAYSDIKQAYYRLDYRDNKIKYSLVFKKLLYDKIVDVDVEYESTGTLQLLEIIPFLLMCVEGETVIIDEIDTGIHDLLVNNILGNIVDSINGQLIITTHNTMLLDSDIAPSYIYTFMVDRNANKSLTSIVEYEDRTHPNLNYRTRYLKGMYGGVPISRDIDFDELWDMMD
ncbi:MAG: AAA family ATPase [Lachnospiraceae bacterium]|nr:AAA family ATPase [Lachnospiraceae bacterium]